MPQPATSPERYDPELSISTVTPSKTNPRTHFSDSYLAQLASSIRDKGVLEPIIVRPLGSRSRAGVGFEIVAGECRYRASVIAEKTTIPSLIRHYTDEQVLEVQLIENIHRQDLTPLEQAKGYRALIDANPTKHSAETIATRIGMSPAYVWDRMKLNDLVPEAKTILDRELMTVGHAIQIARLKPEDQQRVIKVERLNGYHRSAEGLWEFHGGRLALDGEDKTKKDKYADVKAVSVRELEEWIRDHIRFDVAHAAKAQPLAFEQTAEIVQAAAAQPGRGKKVIAITSAYRVSDEARDDQERTYGRESWKRADGREKSKTCDVSVLGVHASGPHYGQTLQVCVNRDKCRVHWGKEIAAREKTQKLRESGKTKQASTRERRQRETWEAQQRRENEARDRWDKLRPHALTAVSAKVKTGPITAAILQAVIGSMVNGRDVAELKRLLPGAVTLKNFTRALAIVDLLKHDWQRADFVRHAARYRVDLAALEKEKGLTPQTSGVTAKAAKNS